MPEIFRTRDCILWSKRDLTTVVVSNDMVANGWAGGQGVQWFGVVGDERVVTYSEGHFGGYLVWGSDESADQYTAMTRQHLTYQYGVMAFGGSLMATTTYERYTYNSRLSGGPLIALTYTANVPLYLSLRGLWTLEDELSLVSSPLAPAPVAGFAAQIPKSVNSNFLGVQVMM